MKALAAALALASAAPLAAQDLPAWRAVDASTGQIEDLAELEQLARDFPDSVSMRTRLLNAQLSAQQGEAALVSLSWLAERGHVFSERARAQIANLIGEAHAAQARELLLPGAKVVTASEVAATVPAEAGLVESVVTPVPDEVFLVTSITEQTVYLRSPDGSWMRGDIAGANDLSGIAADNVRNLGWIASGNLDGSEEPDQGQSGLIRKVASRAETVMLTAPDGVTLSDLAVGPDGAVYASDPMGGGIYTVASEAKQITELIAPGTFRSPQGLAVSDDGKRLYVSDYRYGLAMVDLVTGKTARLASDTIAALDGIDGLWLHGNELIAVQNGTSPMRITAFALSEDGSRITGYRLLEQAHPEWTEPLGGSIAGDALYYVATGQWDRYDKGALREGMAAIPTVIRKLPLAPR
ncbi:hypothetical protein [Porphyrobacter sp. YT40]|uniref:hypothetical protein n=1 Tax=Porphyrobacter sp. YT40 TaxID=2547601 RepID=UPI001142D357|nr:hypothetical protein [Porphyrobacter sp. YT40]QDH34782.1 hypothetical protein E2E27_10875 [Porphyrobacter sp. YT40]